LVSETEVYLFRNSEFFLAGRELQTKPNLKKVVLERGNKISVILSFCS